MGNEEFPLTFRDHVLQSLARIENNLDDIAPRLNDHEIRIRDLKTHADQATGRASLLGLFAGGIAATIVSHFKIWA